MRYDTPIYFEKLSPGVYDETVGDYGEPVVVSTKRLASVVNTSDKQMRLIYGGIREGSKTISLLNAYGEVFDRIRVISLLNAYGEVFDRIRVGSKLYTVDRRISLRTKQAFVCSEIQKRG